MKKMINKPEDLTKELLEGFSMAFPGKIRLTDNRIVTRVTPKAEGKVALVTLGGTGHEPGLSGFVGDGILDACQQGQGISAVSPGSAIAKRIILHEAFPNPFNPPTVIAFELLEHTVVNLRVFDVSGRRIRRLVDRSHGPGLHSVRWNGTSESGARVSRGIYWYAIRGLGKAVLVKKMVVQ